MVDDTRLELGASGGSGQAAALAIHIGTGFADAPPDGGRPAGSRPAVVLAVVSTGVILTGVDLFIVNVALPQIGDGLGVRNIPDLSWLLSAYTVVFAALLIPMGRLADRSSRKWGFLLG